MIYVSALDARDILADVDMPTAERAYGCNPQMYRFDLETASMDFVTRCNTSGNPHEQRVQLIDFNYIIPEEERNELTPGISFEQLRAVYPELLESNLLVDCRCPFFTYYGRQYIMTQLDTALSPENRFPEIRNPELSGTVCKHLVAVLRKYFH